MVYIDDTCYIPECARVSMQCNALRIFGVPLFEIGRESMMNCMVRMTVFCNLISMLCWNMLTLYLESSV